VKGTKGELVQSFEPLVSFTVNETEVQVNRKNDSKQARSMHGLYRSLLSNMVSGVSQGFTKTLVINGVGYRAEVNGKVLLLNLGYSNQVEYVTPEGVEISVDGTNKVKVSGIDKALVGQVAAEIRKLRPPEPYKGKGIRYDNENVRRKVGKSGVK
jgi:large subunit ribosomal protein L6